MATSIVFSTTLPATLAVVLTTVLPTETAALPTETAALPTEVARKTSEKYVEAYRKLTGRQLDV